MTPTFIATIFALIIITSLLVVGAPSSCGAVTLACIVTAVPHPQRPDPNIWRGSQVTRVLQLLCLLRVQAQIYLCAVWHLRGGVIKVATVFSTRYTGEGAPIPSNYEVVTRACILQPLCVVATVLSTTLRCS